MLRAPTWIMSAYWQTTSRERSSSASVTTGSPDSRPASRSASSPSRPSPWKEYGEVRGL